MLKPSRLQKQYFCAVVIIGTAFSTSSCNLIGLFTAAPGTPIGPDVVETCNRPPNGCGPAGILGPLVPECPVPPACFIDACDEHDLCYRPCGIAKSTCDNLFLLNMRAACADAFDSGDPELDRCNSVAFVYAAVVDLFGNEIFQVVQLLGCACERLGISRVIPLPETANVLAMGPPYLDGDGDLLPDEWESAVGLDPNDPQDAMMDPDGDGAVNLVEFIRNTDPFIPSEE